MTPSGVAPREGFTVGSGGGPGGGGVTGLFWRRSLEAPLTLTGFFFVAVSPFRPSGVDCVFSILILHGCGSDGCEYCLLLGCGLFLSSLVGIFGLGAIAVARLACALRLGSQRVLIGCQTVGVVERSNGGPGSDGIPGRGSLSGRGYPCASSFGSLLGTGRKGVARSLSEANLFTLDLLRLRGRGCGLACSLGRSTRARQSPQAWPPKMPLPERLRKR